LFDVVSYPNKDQNFQKSPQHCCTICQNIRIQAPIQLQFSVEYSQIQILARINAVVLQYKAHLYATRIKIKGPDYFRTAVTNQNCAMPLKMPRARQNTPKEKRREP